jgi:hypothetical protein
MKKILLAIEGVAPDPSTFDYAIGLCKRMHAGLDILQILSLRSCKKYLKKIKKGARHARSVFEDTMVAVTFAEAGRHDIAEQMKIEACDNIDRLIPNSEESGIDYHLTLISGNAGEEIVRYVRDHREVVLTIYDAFAVQDAPEYPAGKKRNEIPEIAQKLPTPLVLRKVGGHPQQSGS